MQMDLIHLRQGAEERVLFQDSIFTIVEVSFQIGDTILCAEGLSQRSHLDLPNCRIGQAVALGRALKALRIKLIKGDRYPIRHKFMG